MAAPHPTGDHAAMKNTNRRGTTLLELACVLTLAGILAGIAAAPFQTACNVYAVREARAAIVAASARARAQAVNHGGADLTIDSGAGTMRITTRDRAVDDILPVSGAFPVQ